jgi:hypothetical protein
MFRKVWETPLSWSYLLKTLMLRKVGTSYGFKFPKRNFPVLKVCLGFSPLP